LCDDEGYDTFLISSRFRNVLSAESGSAELRGIELGWFDTPEGSYKIRRDEIRLRNQKGLEDLGECGSGFRSFP